MAILLLLLKAGTHVTDVHHLTGVARSTIGRCFGGIGMKAWAPWKSLPAGVLPSFTYRQDSHLTGAAHAVFSARFWLSAQPLVYRTGWLSNNRLGPSSAPQYFVDGYLMGIVWRRPVPTLRIKDPAYPGEKWRISTLLWPL